MGPFYQDNLRTLYQKDCQDMSELDAGSVDLLATDPPYGISFMGKDWDRALPDKQIWRECLRVLKPGAFAFVMSIPRADCLSRMIISLEDAGFRVDFTPIFWTYASGFPKAQNIGKAVDKKLGTEREIVGKVAGMGKQNPEWHGTAQGRKENAFKPEYDATISTSPQAQALDGSYGGFQPKPAVEVIIVVMKPLSEKTFVDQALKNQKGMTWLDDCRIPYKSNNDIEVSEKKNRHADFDSPARDNKIFGEDNRPRSEQGNYSASAGRFPANLIVSDDVLDDGRISKSSKVGFKGIGWKHSGNTKDEMTELKYQQEFNDSGSFSRYFDLDKWWAKTFPFLIVPKASKSEKNRGIGIAVPRTIHGSTPRKNETENKSPNCHPTVKPLKLMSYLITLGSREGDVVLDNFGGSGTTGVAAALLNRRCIMYEIRKDYCAIAAGRCSQGVLEF
ncbi:MAG: hypothetical protein E3J81_02535 [Dehalococcoidia bacterium]|nr:MAG: hypothetical protein E3J81_02535 [Dehalococcoidia bacterium]